MAKKNKSKRFSLFINGKFDYTLLIITLLLLTVGLIVLLSASAPKALSEDDSSYSYFIKQSMFAGAGLILMFIISKFDYRILKNKGIRWIIYLCTVAVLIIVGISGASEKGATRWLVIGKISLQPSEIAKVSLIVFFAAILSDTKEKGQIRKIIPGFFKPVILLIPIIYAVYIKQNHLSATIVICAITFVQMFVVGSAIASQFRYLIPMFIAGVGGITYIIQLAMNAENSSTEDFRFGRIQTWLNPEADPKVKGWQINQSLYAIGSGGMFGLGLGNSKQKYLYLPEPQNDFIFSVLAEELGFFGSVLVILLFVLFVWRGIVIAMKSQDTFGTLIAIGVTTMIGIQALINLAVVTNTIPVTGMPLPFFSYGGSAMMSDLIAIGFLLSVSRNSKKNLN